MQQIAMRLAAVLGLGALASMAGCGGGAEDATARGAEGQPATQRLEAETASLERRVERRVERLHDTNEIERLQRAYGYYVDRADWDAVVDLLTDDATAEYGGHGVYVGKDSIRALLYALGGGDAGLELGVLNEHIQLQPVIDVAADGETARGRWRLLGILGRYEDDARWRAGAYENEYRHEDGRWKISRIRFAESFTVPFDGGLTTQVTADAAPALDLPPPDRPPTFEDEPWPDVSLLPFHFEHPVAGRAAAQGESAQSTSPAAGEPLEARAAALAREVERLEDEREIEILQRTYGYYVDKNLWRQIADLFADDGTLEIGGRGVFVGRDRVLEYLEWLGEPEHGRLYDHTQMQGVVTVAADGRTAKGRWRALVFGGNEGGISVFGDCIYENEYRKVDGVWRISKLHSYFIMYTNWDQGWARMGWPNTRPEEELPPDRPPTVVYDMYPGELTAPIHYAHPVTGESAPAVAPTEPADGTGTAAADADADADAEAAAGADTSATAETATGDAVSAENLAARIAELGRRIARLEDADAVERLQNVYGYYHDARRWDDAAALFAEDGTSETAQRGVYVGRARVRASLDLEGAPGLEDGVMSLRLQYQPVVHVAPDGRTAELRSRELVLAGEHGGEARIGGNIYENVYVNEDGVWKIAKLHRYTTFLADYERGWAHGALPMPGVSDALPPDRPPSEVYEAFPAFHVMPFHYDHPVTGLPPVPE